MSKNTLNFFSVLLLVLMLASCTSTAKFDETILPSSSESHSSPMESILIFEGNSEAESNINTNRIEMLDTEFEANTPEPNGSTASMLAYAEAYLDVWQTEVDALLSATPSLYEDFIEFEAQLDVELEVLANEYSACENALYGTAVSYELVWHEANALRDWLSKYYS